MSLRKALFDRAVDGALQRGTPAADVLLVEAESQANQHRLAAERALDAVLADSFPASDPPSWTLGVTHSAQETGATNETFHQSGPPFES